MGQSLGHTCAIYTEPCFFIHNNDSNECSSNGYLNKKNKKIKNLN
jgi:hypothetical protein